MVQITFNNETFVVHVYNKDKLEKEIIPNTYGMKEPVHFIKCINGYNIYAGITICDQIEWYATVA